MTPDEIEKDREMPSTSWAVWAWQAYRDGALVDPATLTAENAALKARVAKLETALHRISLASQDSGSTKEGIGIEARATLKELGYE